jgi:valyl-tRNA synthetase
LANIDDFDIVRSKVDNAVSFHIGADEWYIPLNKEIDVESEIKIIDEEIAYLRGFLTSVNKKLGNERFVQNAPEKVVALEKKKKSDAERRIEALEVKLENLKSTI